jgi:hemerythrin
MALIIWDKKYSVKVSRLDADHKQLADLINQLHDAMLTGKGKTEVQAVLTSLIAYTKRHFAYEEDLLRKTNYPGLPEQLQEHKKLCATVDGFAERVSSGGAVTMEVMAFLKDWLLTHILKTDMKYSAHLNACSAA